MKSPTTPPEGIHPALARLVEAMARQAARDDYEKARKETANG